MEEEKEKISVFHLFRFADRVDLCLVVLGLAGSIGDGLLSPLTMLVLGSMINTYGTAGSSLSNNEINEVSLAT